MAHFTNINSLNDLKRQYRSLAFANHPDKGGSVEVMQEINNEYDMLYKIWINRMPEEMQPADKTGSESRSRFYSQNGWEGSRYNSSLLTKDITKLVRKYCKEQWNQWKFSVCCKLSSGCAEIFVKLKGGPLTSGTCVTDDFSNKYGVQTSYKFHNNDKRIAPEAEIVMKDVIEYLQSFNYDDSDSMVDYFDTNFYVSEEVAGADEWEEIHRIARIKPHETSTEVSIIKDPSESKIEDDIEVLQYSEKCYAIFGNTKPIKDSIKAAGGRFNKFLKRGTETTAGWIIPNKGRTIEEIKALIKGF